MIGRSRRCGWIIVVLAAVIAAASIGWFGAVTGAAGFWTRAQRWFEPGEHEGPTSYVALGDSYTAGPLIPNQQPNPLGCLKSDHNYRHLVALALQVPTFRDASYSGATTANISPAVCPLPVGSRFTG